MLDYLKSFKHDKYDFLTFLDGEEEDSIMVSGQTYNDPGEKIGGGDLGDSYHIVLFRNHETEDRYIDLDCFDAILIEPLEYISGLIKSGFYGIVARQTTTSKPIIDRIVDKMQEM
jgi:hypothetical protein